MSTNAAATLTVKLRDLASPKIAGLSRRLGKAGSEFKKLQVGKRLGRDLGKLRKNLGGVLSMATRAGVALGGTGLIAGGVFAKGVIDATAKMEMLEAALVTMEGSTKAARAAMAKISEFSDKTPFELETVAEAYTRLRVLGMEPTEKLMRTMGDTAAAMGKPMLQPIEAIADAMTGSNERLKELGITAAVAGEKVTFAWVESGKTVTKTVDRTNKLLVADTISTIWNDRYAGAMKRMSQTWDGLMSTLKSKWFLFQVAVGRSGLMDKLKDRLVALLDQINKWTEDGTLERWAKQIGDAFSKAFDEVAKAFNWLKKNWPEVKAQMKEAWRVFTKEVVPALKDIAKWLKETGTAASKAVGGPKNLAKILAALAALKVLAPLGGIAKTFFDIGVWGFKAATGTQSLTTAVKVFAASSVGKLAAVGAAAFAATTAIDRLIGKRAQLEGGSASQHLGKIAGESSGFNRFVAGVGNLVGSDTLVDAARGNMRQNANLAVARGDRAQSLRSAMALAGSGASPQEVRAALDVRVKVDQDGRVKRTEVHSRGGMDMNLGEVATP